MKKTMNKVAALGLVLASVVAIAAPAQAEVKLANGISFGSTIFADYLNQTTATGGVTSAAQTIADEGLNGFHVTRAYLYMSDKINDDLFGKIVLDANKAPATGKANVFLKNAFMHYNLNSAVAVEAGLTGTPWIGFEEGIWGHRYLGALSTTPGQVLVDRKGILSSADGGVSLVGAANGFNYQVGAYNGEGYGTNANGGGLKFAGRVGYEFDNGLGLAAYYDSETKRTGTVGYDPTRMIGMVYYKQPAFKIAAQYVAANDFAGTVAPAGATFADGNGYSVWGVVSVMPQVNLLAKYDGFTNVTRTGVAGANITNTTFLAGAEYVMAPGQAVTLAYSSDNNGAATATTVNTLAVNLLTGF